MNDEERQLWEQYRVASNPTNRANLESQLLRLYEQLAAHWISRYSTAFHKQIKKYPEIREDLVQLVNLGLLDAIRRYSLDHIDKSGQQTSGFTRLAELRIHHEIWHSNDFTNGYRRTARDRARHVGRIYNRLFLELRRDPTDEELAKESGLSVEQVREALRMQIVLYDSLDEELEGTETDREASSSSDNMDLLPVGAEPTPEVADLGEQGVLISRVESILKTLTALENQLLFYRFNLNLSYREISEVLGMSKEDRRAQKTVERRLIRLLEQTIKKLRQAFGIDEQE